MKVFIDTEFSTFDERFCELISAGLVDETGKRELYLEIREWDRDYATDFVREVVVPLLDRVDGAQCSRLEAAYRLERWLNALPEPATIVTDSGRDIELLRRLLGRPLPNVSEVVVLTGGTLAACELRIDAYFSGFPNKSRHHALEDAQALRLAYLARLPRIGT